MEKPPKIWYAVQSGHQPGVYEDWVSCGRQLLGHPRPVYSKFLSEEEARLFVAAHPMTEAPKTVEETRETPFVRPRLEEMTKYLVPTVVPLF